MPYQFLLCQKREKVALLTLNRPDKRNALSIALRNEIDQCLAEIIGGGLARDLCLSGCRIDAQEAHRIGLVNQVVPSDRLLDEAMAVANSIAEAPLGALQAVKTMIIQTYSWGYEEGAGEWFSQLRPSGS